MSHVPTVLKSDRSVSDKMLPVDDNALMIDSYILAYLIRISEILPWDRKSYLTQAILPRLSREDYINWLHWDSRTWSSSDVIVMFK